MVKNITPLGIQIPQMTTIGAALLACIVIGVVAFAVVDVASQ